VWTKDYQYHDFVFTPPLAGEWSIVVCMPVRLVSVCLVFVCEHMSGTSYPILIYNCHALSMAVTSFSSGGVPIRYVLPVLWITSYLHGMARSPGIGDAKKRIQTSTQCGLTGTSTDLKRDDCSY